MPNVLIAVSSTDAEKVEKLLLPGLHARGIATKLSCPTVTTNDFKWADWCVVVLSPASVKSSGVRRISDIEVKRRPDRVLPIFLEKCDPGKVHPRFELQGSIDFVSNPKAAMRTLLSELLGDEPEPKGPVGEDQPIGETEGLGRDEKSRTARKPSGPSKILMFLSLKGGVGKTSTALGVAECLACAGKRVLVIDLDHQCAASALILGEERLDELDPETRGRGAAKRGTITELIAAGMQEGFDPERIHDFVHPAESSIGHVKNNLSVICSSIELEEFLNISGITKRFSRFTDILSFWKLKTALKMESWLRNRYDFVLIDCPPTLAWQVRLFLHIADGYVLPSIPDRLSLRGARYLVRRLEQVKSRLRPLGLVWTLYSEVGVLHRTVVESSSQGDDLFTGLPLPLEAKIPRTVASPTGMMDAYGSTATARTFNQKYGVLAKHFIDLSKELLVRTASKEKFVIGASAGAAH